MKEEAINLLNENYNQKSKLRESSYIYLKNSPYFNNLHDDTRFKEILKKEKKLYEENLKKYVDL